MISRLLSLCLLSMVAMACSTFGGGAARCGSATAPLNGPDWTSRGAKFTPDGAADRCGQMTSGILHLAGPMPAAGVMDAAMSKDLVGLPTSSDYVLDVDVEPIAGCASAVNVSLDGGAGLPTVATASGNHYRVTASVVRTSLAVWIGVKTSAPPCDVRISNLQLRRPSEIPPSAPPPVPPAARAPPLTSLEPQPGPDSAIPGTQPPVSSRRRRPAVS